MKKQLGTVVIMMVVLGILAAVADAGNVWYQDLSGTTDYFESATWAELQTAITKAQGGSGGTGLVRISGDISRSGDTATGDLDIASGGKVTVSGGWGWNSGTHEPTTQGTTPSILDAQCPNDTYFQRVIEVAAPQVTLQNLKVTGGRSSQATDNYGTGIRVGPGSNDVLLKDLYVVANRSYYNTGGYGGGISVEGTSSSYLTGFKMSNCEISANYRGRGNGAGMFMDYVGTSSSPAVVEYSTIKDNDANARSPGYPGSGGGMFINLARVLVANCRITGNKAGDGGGSGVFIGPVDWGGEPAGNVIFFNTLVAGNTGTDYQVDSPPPANTPGAAFFITPGGTGVNAGKVFLANCTIADNHNNYALWLTAYRSGSANQYVSLLNTVFGTIGASPGQQGMNLENYWYNSANHAGNLVMQNTTIDDSDNALRQEALGTPEGAYVTQTSLLAALSQASARYHSLTGANVESQNLEDNLDGDPSFLNSGADPYQLDKTSNSIDNGLVRFDGRGFTFVDINHDGDYDALTDVIIAGAPPAGSNFVYMTDLLGNDRVRGLALDRGAYEAEPLPVAEPATLGLLGLALLGLRKRRS